MNKVLYTGSFDPITKGHMFIIDEASSIFDEVIVAILKNPSKKQALFSVDERLEIIRELYKNRDNIKVIIGECAAVDIALLNECKAIIRGLRNDSDFEYEVMMNQINRDISSNQIKTVCMFTNPELSYVSSSAVKEVFYLNKDVSKYVDKLVMKKMIQKRERDL